MNWDTALQATIQRFVWFLLVVKHRERAGLSFIVSLTCVIGNYQRGTFVFRCIINFMAYRQRFTAIGLEWTYCSWQFIQAVIVLYFLLMASTFCMLFNLFEFLYLLVIFLVLNRWIGRVLLLLQLHFACFLVVLKLIACRDARDPRQVTLIQYFFDDVVTDVPLSFSFAFVGIDHVQDALSVVASIVFMTSGRLFEVLFEELFARLAGVFVQ